MALNLGDNPPNTLWDIPSHWMQLVLSMDDSYANTWIDGPTNMKTHCDNHFQAFNCTYNMVSKIKSKED
jgi:hypothetical protein